MEILDLIVMRDIQDTRDCTDCAWIAQVTDPVIFKELESAGHSTNELCGRRVGLVMLPSPCTYGASYDAMHLWKIRE